MLAGLVAKGLDSGQGGIGFEQGVVDPAGESLGGALRMRNVDVVGCRAQGIGDGGVGPGEQFGVGGHMGNDIRAGFRRIGSQ